MKGIVRLVVPEGAEKGLKEEGGETEEGRGRVNWTTKPQCVDNSDSMQARVSRGLRLHHCTCRFVDGGVPGNSSNFEISRDDWQYMEGCDNLVVVSAVFGETDASHGPCLS